MTAHEELEEGDAVGSSHLGLTARRVYREFRIVGAGGSEEFEVRIGTDWALNQSWTIQVSI